jgi:hypothetical protein
MGVIDMEKRGSYKIKKENLIKLKIYLKKVKYVKQYRLGTSGIK